MRWRAKMWSVGLVIFGAGLTWAATLKAQKPEAAPAEGDVPATIELDSADPVAEGLRLRQILKRPSVVSGESFAPFETEMPQAAAAPQPPTPALAPVEGVLPEVQLLRDAAWQLEQTAHQLECRELYEQADQLRATAQQFRADARRLRANTP